MTPTKNKNKKWISFHLINSLEQDFFLGEFSHSDNKKNWKILELKKNQCKFEKKLPNIDDEMTMVHVAESQV